MTTPNSKAPRIVMVLPTYLPETFGGAEQQSRKLAMALSRLGATVTVLAPRLAVGTPSHETDDTVRLRRFRLRQPPNLGGRHMGSFLLWSIKLIWWLSRNRQHYDVIHIIHGRLHALPAVLAGAMLNKPTLIKLGRGGVQHFDLDLVRRKRWFGPWYASMLLRHTTGFVANSQEIVDDLQRWRVSSDRIHRIPNGVEIPEVSDQRSATSQIKFVYLGRLEAEKSLDLMIDSFAQVSPRDSLSLSLVGDGSSREDLEKRVNRHGLQGVVTFTGVVNDVGAVLREADVFVSTSASEGMSNALLEAMSFGVMPVVSRVSGVSDIVEDASSGLLFEPGNAEAFIHCLDKVIALTPAQRVDVGRKARTTVAERFGIDQVARRHLELYATLSGAAHAPVLSQVS